MTGGLIILGIIVVLLLVIVVFRDNELNNKRTEEDVESELSQIHDGIFHQTPEDEPDQKPRTWFDHVNPHVRSEGLGWWKVNNGEYYVNVRSYKYRMYTYTDVYRLKDWVNVTNQPCDGVDSIEECESPHKTHWQHFLNLEIKEKQRRAVDCLSHVQKILDIHKEYNVTLKKHGMIESQPLTDYERFVAFCKEVSHSPIYEEWEVTKSLLTIRSNKG